MNNTEMKTLEVSDFGRFFAALNDGFKPFSWQSELLHSIVETGRWPDRIVAPTGAGKSSVVDVHLFANALAAAGAASRVPRRLSVVVNRRALVDNQVQRAEAIQERMRGALNGEADDPIIVAVAELLESFRTAKEPELGPFLMGHLRGELPGRFLPVDDPSACAIIAATPDMFGSRLLFRGYGGSLRARPRDTAIVAMDNVLVLDEAHLNRQLLATARRIAELQGLERSIGIPLLQVVETTATSARDAAEDFREIGVDPGRLGADADVELARRIHSDKGLTLSPVEYWTGKPRNAKVIAHLVEESQRLIEAARQQDHPNRAIGCIVNHVETALGVSKALEKAGYSVETLVGRMRPLDSAEIQEKLAVLQDPGNPTEIDVVVSTQTLEVGVDVDFAGLVTELASASALAQRFGRVNRRGERKGVEVNVVVPAVSSAIKPQHPPYAGDDLLAALEWLGELREIGAVSPANLDAHVPPVERPRRLLFQRPELMDIEGWARTGDILFEDDELDLWLKDDLEPDTAQGGVVFKDGLPLDDVAAAELVGSLKPEAREVCPANLKLVREVMETVLESHRPRCFLFRDGEVELITEPVPLKPGDVLVIDPDHRVTTKGVIVEAPTDAKSPTGVWPERILTVEVLEPAGPEVSDHAELFSTFREMTPEEATEEWNSRGHTGSVSLSTSIVDLDGRGNECVSWFYVEDPDTANTDSDVGQIWTRSKASVTLADHQQDVADRARELNRKIGVDTALQRAVVDAAHHHDDGKSDARFQMMLGRCDEQPALAKSRFRSKQQAKRAAERSGLPKGWRHEQMSVVLAAASGIDDELTLRIIGCSHGHGRSGFPHTGDGLVPDDYPPEMVATAERLFTLGVWDSLIERTTRNIGAYAVSYFEAIERAADAQISSEGR
ncbi:type I-U CRISPR-associated helicase/endonuclease Cas3 [Corynebacterium xerosis]|uniref:Type I-U CRISPR-associated helicase/endonuclease Cas3 n=1 Tax=Corynebacterium xerosis TaxID=1725 RepID=A0A6B8TEV4_9CORY|nr:type I-U CRISPR-associated helicase/endonuclease Cas3 [Corynebacterium xerosis]QGS35397.1 type I-U CRISPR-associated helicase/endonuclease Cas3 [Corynebacterium xerosis]